MSGGSKASDAAGGNRPRADSAGSATSDAGGGGGGVMGGTSSVGAELAGDAVMAGQRMEDIASYRLCEDAILPFLETCTRAIKAHEEAKGRRATPRQVAQVPMVLLNRRIPKQRHKKAVERDRQASAAAALGAIMGI